MALWQYLVISLTMLPNAFSLEFIFPLIFASFLAVV